MDAEAECACMGPRAEDLIGNPLPWSVAAIRAWEKEVRKRARKKKKDIAFDDDDAAAAQPIDQLPLRPASITTDEGEHEDEDEGKREHEDEDALLTDKLHEQDWLRPTAAEMKKTLWDGRGVWRGLHEQATSSSPWALYKEWEAPSTLLHAVPEFPEHLPYQPEKKSNSIIGQGVWRVRHPELEDEDDTAWDPDELGHSQLRRDEDEHWDPEEVYGTTKHIFLNIAAPATCQVRPQPSPHPYGDGEPNCISILTLCWAYIFNTRFREMQNAPRPFSSTRKLEPVLAKGFKAKPKDVVIDLTSASHGLVRWLSALLAPGGGWVVGAPIQPWTARCEMIDGYSFVVTMRQPRKMPAIMESPTSDEAASLLTEFCGLFETDFRSSGSLPQLTRGFLAAVTLPFCTRAGLEPRLPAPKFVRRPAGIKTTPVSSKCILDYMKHIRYFMTLGLTPNVVESTIWSIFWQPGLACNVVSAWFASILEVITPDLDAGNTDTLCNMFALRRKRVGLLWRAVFDLGDSKVLSEWIKTFLTQIPEKNMTSDIDAAAWIGAPQSFLDEQSSGKYDIPTPSDRIPVARSEIYRLRFNFSLMSRQGPCPPWPPFGYVSSSEIEPELLPALRSGLEPRKFEQWIWHMEFKGRRIQKRVLPFTHEAAKDVECINDSTPPNNNEIVLPTRLGDRVLAAPSRSATYRTLNSAIIEGSGDHDLSLENTWPKGVRNHAWMED